MPSPAPKPLPTREDRRVKREAGRAKQREENVGRAAKMHTARLVWERSACSQASAPATPSKAQVHVGCSGWFYWHWRATSRAMCGYLLVRGGVHIVAYAKALEKLTDTPVGGLLPIPDVSNKKFPKAMALEAQGLHTIMWKWCPSDTYTQVGEIWNGPHPEDGMELEVRDEMPPGFPWPEMPDEPQICAPGEIDPEMLNYYAKKLG
jgi:hypothetical protein